MNVNREELLARTEEILELHSQDFPTPAEAEGVIEELRNILKEHNHLYYIEQDPIISDFEWDRLFRFLKDLESKFPSLITPDSPTQKIALEVQTEFEKADHLFPMISLDNTYNAEDLRDFDTRLRKFLPEGEEVAGVSAGVRPGGGCLPGFVSVAVWADHWARG